MLKRFIADRRGTTAMLFGLALLPVMGFAGAAVDYGRASNGRAHLQKAIDATALALVREAPRASDAELRRKGQALFEAMLKDQRLVAPAPLKVTRTGPAIRVEGAATMRTAVLGIVGFRELTLESSAESTWGAKKIELALVLDNTGSMASRNKMQELKAASHDLLRELRRVALDADAIRVSIVPFDSHVRIDPGQRHADWLRFADSAQRAAWTGYVADRDQPHDAGAARAQTARPETLYPAASRTDTDLARVRPLTSVVNGYGALTATIDAMKPKGCTNITIGAAWGLASLAGGEPLPGATGGKDVERIMILLTDGDNTMNRWVNDCTQRGDRARIDARTRAACGEVKGAGVRLYTIRVIEGNAGLLRDCASVGADGQPLYYDVQDAARLRPVFQAIVTEILGTRLTH